MEESWKDNGVGVGIDVGVGVLLRTHCDMTCVASNPHLH